MVLCCLWDDTQGMMLHHWSTIHSFIYSSRLNRRSSSQHNAELYPILSVHKSSYLLSRRNFCKPSTVTDVFDKILKRLMLMFSLSMISPICHWSRKQKLFLTHFLHAVSRFPALRIVVISIPEFDLQIKCLANRGCPVFCLVFEKSLNHVLHLVWGLPHKLASLLNPRKLFLTLARYAAPIINAYVEFVVWALLQLLHPLDFPTTYVRCLPCVHSVPSSLHAWWYHTIPVQSWQVQNVFVDRKRHIDFLSKKEMYMFRRVTA